MKFLLNTINKFKNRNSKINRASINYRDSKHLGVLYKYIDENKQKALNDFSKKFLILDFFSMKNLCIIF